MIDLDGMVDDELDGLKRIDSLRIASQPHDAVAHRGEVHDRWHAGEILEQHTGRSKGDLFLRHGRDVPPRHRRDVLGVNESSVLASQQIFEKDLQGVGQPRDAAVACALERRQAEYVVRSAAGGQPGPRLEGILGSHPLIILHSTWRAQVRAAESHGAIPAISVGRLWPGTRARRRTDRDVQHRRRGSSGACRRR